MKTWHRQSLKLWPSLEFPSQSLIWVLRKMVDTLESGLRLQGWLTKDEKRLKIQGSHS